MPPPPADNPDGAARRAGRSNHRTHRRRRKMGKIMSSAAMAVLAVVGLAGAAAGEALTPDRGCMVPSNSSNEGLTERLQSQRYTVVTVDPSEGRLVVRSDAGRVFELTCGADTRVTIAGRGRVAL